MNGPLLSSKTTHSSTFSHQRACDVHFSGDVDLRPRHTLGDLVTSFLPDIGLALLWFRCRCRKRPHLLFRVSASRRDHRCSPSPQLRERISARCSVLNVSKRPELSGKDRNRVCSGNDSRRSEKRTLTESCVMRDRTHRSSDGSALNRGREHDFYRPVKTFALFQRRRTRDIS